MTEQLKEAIERLKKHNEWRRGADIDMCEPKQLGKDIETLIQYASECQELREEKEIQEAVNGILGMKYKTLKEQNETLRREIAGYREALTKLEKLGTCWQRQGVMGSQMFIIGTAVVEPCREALKTNDGQGGE